jgi:hypothetical protein
MSARVVIWLLISPSENGLFSPETTVFVEQHGWGRFTPFSQIGGGAHQRDSPQSNFGFSGRPDGQEKASQARRRSAPAIIASAGHGRRKREEEPGTEREAPPRGRPCTIVQVVSTAVAQHPGNLSVMEA